MIALRRLQQTFFASVISSEKTVFPQQIETDRFSASQRAAVYIDGYRARLTEALRDSFPALHTLLGDDAFSELAAAYIRAHPSRHFSIRYFGDQLANFLAEQTFYQQQPVLAEMARFEWTLRDVFDAPGACAANLIDLAQLDPVRWGTIRFRAHPALRRVALTWNVPTLWKAIDSQEPPLAPRCQAEPAAWIVWRKDLQTFFESMPSHEARAFDVLISSASFGEFCECLAEELGEEQAALQAAQYLGLWLKKGWLE